MHDSDNEKSRFTTKLWEGLVRPILIVIAAYITLRMARDVWYDRDSGLLWATAYLASVLFLWGQLKREAEEWLEKIIRSAISGIGLADREHWFKHVIKQAIQEHEGRLASTAGTSE